MIKETNKDLLNVCNDIVFLMGNKLYNKTLAKDEMLTYCSALRLIKAVADKVSDSYYVDGVKQFGIKNDWDENLGDEGAASGVKK